MHGNMNCRVCCNTKTYSNTQIYKLDDINFREEDTIGEQIISFQNDFIKYLQKSKKNIEIKNKYDNLINMGVYPGINPLPNNFQLTKNCDVGFYIVNVVDILHTFYKGNMEYAITWAIAIISSLTNNHNDLISRLDKRIKKLSQKQALNPFKNHKR